MGTSKTFDIYYVVEYPGVVIAECRNEMLANNIAQLLNKNPEAIRQEKKYGYPNYWVEGENENDN